MQGWPREGDRKGGAEAGGDQQVTPELLAGVLLWLSREIPQFQSVNSKGIGCAFIPVSVFPISQLLVPQ